MSRIRHQVRARIVLLFCVALVTIVILIFRVGWIQLSKNNLYQKRALQQRLRTVKVEPKRGVIYDRNGVELAVSASSDTVVAAPQDIENPKETAKKLAEILEMSQAEIYQELTKDLAAVYISRKISVKKAQQIQKLDLSGIYFTEESKRFYPKGNLAAHVLGFAGIDSQGLQGIELSYDQQLRGDPGRISIESDAVGREIPKGIKDYVAPDDGNDVYLTIDHVLQYIAERELKEAMNENEAKGGTIIMMDPQTGDVLALANQPTYNPNHFANYTPRLWRNRAISNSYEPGSTFKIITASAGLEEGVVHPTDTFYDPGYIEVAGQRINCWKSGGHGKQTFAEVVKNSCNPGFVQVGQRVGEEKFYKYIKAFGFGEETGIRLPGEAEGLIYDLEDVGPVELATISFGHGISVTPIQLITAVSAVANNGQLLQPHLVNKIKNPNGKLIKKIKPEPVRKVISKETAKTVRKLLEGVVADGSGKKAAVKGYRIGGKTGTAKHYGTQLYDSSFIGMVPIEKPQLVTLVVLYGVSSYPYYGSQVGAPIFHDVVKDAVRYLEIPPSNKPMPEESDDKLNQVEVPNVSNLTLEQAENKLIQQGLQVKLEGQGEKVVAQIPQPGAVVNKKSTVILFFKGALEEKNKYQVTVPNLEGMTVKEAARLLGELGLKLKSSGKGVINNQDPAAGFTIDSGKYVKVWSN
ncbi:stage V sporulation protein D [Halobacteroides halobius DSM 5150]|uniref:Stage V sporulation protein D n=1 Tax=Halobacteroides halobius (strain ATCC 35273 / DSM 5150 / MD-1) TaxID=748449 RepID=L0KAZ7_HALHC|nr:stage V sporulation protein D [Halobacteroides halobius]AGB41710.1 stage V sporulation protein D [Halobacteroides halobius DSM 5150]